MHRLKFIRLGLHLYSTVRMLHMHWLEFQ